MWPSPSDVLVVLDDLALPLGRLRVRGQGSDGGHNGLASLLAVFGTERVPRLRIGIGSVPVDGWRAYVLAPFDPAECEIMDGALDRAVGAILGFLEGRSPGELAATTNTVPPPG